MSKRAYVKYFYNDLKKKLNCLDPLCNRKYVEIYKDMHHLLLNCDFHWFDQ